MLKKSMQRFVQMFHEPKDAVNIGFFRLFFGLGVFIYSLFYFTPQAIEDNFIRPYFYFSFDIFTALGLQPWNGPGMYVHFMVLIFSALLMALGVFTRITTAVFLFAFTYVFLLEKALYTDAGYLVILISFLLLISRSGSSLSYDSLRGRSKSPAVWHWEIILLKGQFLIVWFFGIINKLNADWLIFAQPVKVWMEMQNPLFLSLEWLPFFIARGLISIEIIIFVLLVTGRNLFVAFLFYVVSLAVSAVCFDKEISFLSWLLFFGFVLFVDSERLRELKRIVCAGCRLTLPVSPQQALIKPSKAAIFFVVAYFLVQIAVPLRHLIFPGHVDWTEEGSRFAWRQAANRKDVHIIFQLRDSKTKECFSMDHGKYLTSAQYKAVGRMPDVLFQYVQMLKKVLINQGVQSPEIVATAYASLNGRPYAPYIYSDADLANSTYPPFTHAHWVVPFKGDWHAPEVKNFEERIRFP